MTGAFRTPARVVSEADVLAFSELTGDRHPQHADADWAAASAFGERIAHGMLVASLALGLVEFDPERVVALRRVREIVFKRPVRLGDAIRVEGAESDRRRVDETMVLVGWSWRVLNQDGELVCRMAVEALCREQAEVQA